ncbi:hypothetical protein ASG43_17615 [Aureimonas sp. Leaf454]|uniref:MucR family transcriptional regulator n=1 Tax=Aureimonas sp. Leaf454 TaxID=1736381 RepID=UPI0006F43AAA|nr:MucR family transcriptional regulator [Aureimonas sp. Leaf454]KQT53657.1 hypothetical protein ASG43_17615 [Aureimonas sp. Leaf454]
MNFDDNAPFCPIDEMTEIVAAYVSNNRVAEADLPALISSVYVALVGTSSKADVVAEAEPQTPAVSIKKSVTDDYIICLNDGKKFKSLKRHIMTHYGLTPDDYRAQWKLPSDYPMVAPNYAAQRSALAKSMGLGRKTGESAPAAKGRATRKAKEAAE